jgi:two-component system response regulator (stage 0 sporulation protein F)
MCRVLVAEDDCEMRRLVVEALRKDGHLVREATDGAGLLEALADAFGQDPGETCVDVVVSDVRMPGFTGLEVVECLSLADHGLPFILMTAFGDDEIRRRAGAAGALLLDKPLSLAELRGAVLRLARH